MRAPFRLIGGAIVVASGLVVAAIACGPGNLHYLTEGDGASPTEPEAEAKDPCKHATVPPPPAAKIGEAQLPQLIFAAQELRLDTAGVPGLLDPPLSLDLDKTCTCAFEAGTSCVLPTGAPMVPCDGDGGRDNVTGPLIAAANGLIPILPPTYLRDKIREGQYSVVVTVALWNGTADDDRVAVGVYMSPGTPRDDNDNFIVPKFDGTDVWTIEQSSIVPGSAVAAGDVCDGQINCPAIATEFNGYVSGGTLVAHFPEIPFAFGAGDQRISIPFTDATLFGKVTTTEVNGQKTYTAEGEIVGRWSADAIVNGVAHISINQDGSVQSVCGNPVFFLGFKQNVCNSVDLAPAAKDDGKGKKCTSMSQAVHFTATPARFGPVKESTPDTGQANCPPGLDTSCHF